MIASTWSSSTRLQPMPSPPWMVGLPDQSVYTPPASSKTGCKRGGVPDVHDRVDHHVGTSRGDQQVSVAVAPGPRDGGCSLQVQVDLLRTARIEAVQLRSQKHRVASRSRCETRAGRGAAESARVPGSAASRRVDALVQSGDVDHAHHAGPGSLDPDQRPVQRHAADETLGPVNRIQNPAETGRSRLLAEFLPQDSVVRKRFPNAAAGAIAPPADPPRSPGNYPPCVRRPSLPAGRIPTSIVRLREQPKRPDPNARQVRGRVRHQGHQWRLISAEPSSARAADGSDWRRQELRQLDRLQLLRAVSVTCRRAVCSNC